MGKDLDRPVWRGQRPWVEAWFAVVLDTARRRSLWVRQTHFVPRTGDPRATVWAAWFDLDATPQTFAAKRFAKVEAALPDEGETLIDTLGCRLSRTGMQGAVEGLAWDVTWSGGSEVHADVPAWLPTPTHTRPIVHDAAAEGTITLGGQPIAITGRTLALHVWGKRRVPTLHWIYAPWIGDGSLEVSAVSLRDTFSLGMASLRLDGPTPHKGRPATAAHQSCLVTSTVAGPRRLIHARAWAEPSQMVGYVYRDTDERDLMVAQSDIGSAQLEIYTRTAPGMHWRPVDERRVAGGVAVEIHQRQPLPGVDYIAWDADARVPTTPPASTAPRPDEVAWPEVRSITALGLTYGDHAKETGQKLDASAPPTSFTKDPRAFAPGDGSVRVPTGDEVLAVLDAVEPGVAATIRERLAVVPAVMDYEGEIALVALGPIDPERLAAGEAQPFGLAAANDLTARFCQALGETTAHPLAYWTAAKSFARFLPVAERVWAPAGGIAKIPEITLETRVNGEVRQKASTKLVIYDLAALVRAASAHLGRPLERGDVILTGTPTGVGMRMSPITRRVAAMSKDRFRKLELLVSSFATSTSLLRPGDLIEVEAGPAGSVRTRLTV